MSIKKVSNQEDIQDLIRWNLIGTLFTSLKEIMHYNEFRYLKGQRIIVRQLLSLSRLQTFDSPEL